MPTQRNQMDLVLLSLLFLATTACDTAIVATPIPPITPTVARIVATATPPRINVTLEEYQQALAKWRRQGIEEYEITVYYSTYSPLLGDWTLQVHTQGDTATVTNYKRVSDAAPPSIGFGSPSFMPTTTFEIAELKKELEIMTIETRFQDIARALAWSGQVPYNIHAQFDPTLGNPTAFATIGVTEGETWNLKQLKVLKQTIPPTP
ncbi:MAG: DUF6174 domain-containing protein [Chloroflexota bacterium]|nr:DUF6174 domain-containing protein [Chloroflexota bacterium]